MIGIIDVGGGMKAIYSAGLLDYCLDNKIYFDYALGVSAGSGNLMNYTSRQIGRAKSFYLDYSFRTEYLSIKNVFKNGEYCNLSYPYEILSNENGESPIDYETLFSSNTYFKGVVTNAKTGKAEYYGEETMSKNDYWISMASSAIPFVSKPYKRFGKAFFDGGIADPIPLKQALQDGCEKVVVILSRPLDYRKPIRGFDKITRALLRKYPNTANAIYNRSIVYNNQIEEFLSDESLKDKVLFMYPSDSLGVDTLSKKKDELEKLFDMGYNDGHIIKAFFNEYKSTKI